MRILITLPWGERLGGAETMLQTILDGARETDHEFELVFFEDGPWPTDLRAAGFRVEVIPTGRLRQIGRLPLSVMRLASIFRHRQPDLIVNWAAKTQLYGAPAAALAGLSDRVLWWQHLIPTGHWIDRCATALPASAVGCSSRTAASAQAKLWPHRPTFVVAPGTRVPPAASERASIDRQAGVPVIGIVGRLQPWKGQDRLLRAQALLRERGHDIHTLIVGGDAYGFSSDYAAALPDLASTLGLSGSVTLTGQVPDAGPYVERMDVLVNASDPEPFGIVLLEAMARGVAVVAVNSGGPAELIEHGRTGMLAPSGEPSDLADALEPLLAAPALRARIAGEGRERFMGEFTDVAMRRRFYAQLGALAGPGRGCPAPAPGPSVPGPAPASANGLSAHGEQTVAEVTIVAHDVGSVGGMERQLAELALGLRGMGLAVTVIARTCELPAGTGIVFRRVRAPGRPFLLAYPWFMVAGSLALRRWRRGVVQATGAIVCNRVDAIAVHYCHQVGPANPSRSVLVFRWHVRIVGLVKRLGERLGYRPGRASAFVCVSEGVAAEMREHYPRLRERLVTIHNGVDTEAFAPGARAAEARALRESLGIAVERPVAVLVGSEWERKGLEPLIRALAQAGEWSLAVAGDGDRQRYQALADSLGVGAGLHWLGVVADIPPVYGMADAFVLPSSYETFSLVTFEAAASGLPILATPVNGVRELIRDGENGFLIAREAPQIAARLRELAADRELRERLGAAARRSALEFSWTRMVAAHRELYARLAPSSSPSSRSVAAGTENIRSTAARPS
jgi:glycosyltransferase involved in cell wall biosynthesis